MESIVELIIFIIGILLMIVSLAHYSRTKQATALAGIIISAAIILLPFDMYFGASNHYNAVAAELENISEIKSVSIVDYPFLDQMLVVYYIDNAGEEQVFREGGAYNIKFIEAENGNYELKVRSGLIKQVQVYVPD